MMKDKLIIALLLLCVTAGVAFAQDGSFGKYNAAEIAAHKARGMELNAMAITIYEYKFDKPEEFQFLGAMNIQLVEEVNDLRSLVIGQIVEDNPKMGVSPAMLKDAKDVGDGDFTPSIGIGD